MPRKINCFQCTCNTFYKRHSSIYTGVINRETDAWILSSLAYDNIETFQDAANELTAPGWTKEQKARGFRDIIDLNELTRKAKEQGIGITSGATEGQSDQPAPDT